MAARRVRADRAVVVDVQAHAGAPSGAVVAAPGERLDRPTSRLDAAPCARARRAAPARLSSRWCAELDVAELGAAGAVVRVAVDARPRPRRAAAGAGSARAPRPCRRARTRCLSSSVMRATHPLAGDRVGDEHDAAVEPRDDYAAVGDVGNVEFDLAAPHLAHPSSLGAWRRAMHGGRMRLYLASTSPARLATLRAVGHRADRDRRRTSTRRPPSPGGRGRSPPDELVLLLARPRPRPSPARSRTASALRRARPRRRLGVRARRRSSTASRTCPRSPASAGTRSAAATAMLHSGHWLIDAPRRRRRRGAVGAARPRRPSASPTTSTDAEIDAYVATGEPLRGRRRVHDRQPRRPRSSSASRATRTTVVGLSASPLVRKLVRELGVEWTDLWNRVTARTRRTAVCRHAAHVIASFLCDRPTTGLARTGR